MILDQGTINLPSDRGGTAYPVNTPTHFVAEAEGLIEREFRVRVEEAEANTLAQEDTVSREIGLARSYLVDIDERVNEIGPELEKNKAIFAQLSEQLRYVSEDRLDDTLARIRNDLYVYVTKEGRVELTAPGSPKRYRPSLNLLRKLVEEY